MTMMDLDSNSMMAGQSSNILERSVCLSLELGSFGTRKKVASGQVNKTDADDDALHVSKEILESKRLEEIKSLDSQIRKYVQSQTVPSPFRAGVYLIALEAFRKVDKRLERYAEERRDLVAEFLAEYAIVAGNAQSRLGSLYDPRDYPDADKVLAAFKFRKRYQELTTPGKLRMVSPEIYDREITNMQADIANATTEIRDMMRASMADLVDHLVDRLTPKPTGEVKIFRDSLVSNVQDFLSTFATRNLVDDGELARLVRQAQDLTAGVNAQMVRDSDGLRDRVRAGFETIKTELDAMMVNRPKRKISFEQ